jgi:YidC/Oxa1 family membrane protein insertase
VVLRAPAPNQRVLMWRAQGGTLDLAVYAGPVEWKSLRVVDATLVGTLFASLWEPLRWLCFALLFLLGFISGQVGNAGVAIILLSLAVKFLLYPLTRVADAWQADVNRAQSRIQPRLDEIRRRYRGEEAHNLTLQVYREEGVHPLYTLKSLAGFAIQVPMFIAAFDMLAGNFALSGAGFLWITDLAAPDRLARLPVELPFVGADLNLLPFLMAAVSVLSALTQGDASLSAALQARQRRNLYLMAGVFFLLFYTFPAGMVLYWTANNVWHLVKEQLAGRVGKRPAT